MTKSFAIFSLGVLFSVCPAAWAHSRPAARYDHLCAMDREDPFERPARITDRSWFFGGRCINTERRRVPQVFEKDSTSGLTPVSNVRHRDQYWIAYLPFDAVDPSGEDTIASINFLVLRQKVVTVYTGHGQLEIIFKNPIWLRSQKDFNRLEQVDRLYFSVEAVVPQGIDENGIMKDLEGVLGIEKGMFPLVGRLATEQERQAEDGKDFWAFHRYPMKLDAEEKTQLFFSAITESDRYGFSRPFQVWQHNCVSTLIDLVDELPRIHALGLPGFHYRLSWDPDLGPAVHDMRLRGLIDPDAEIIQDPPATLNDSLNSSDF